MLGYCGGSKESPPELVIEHTSDPEYDALSVVEMKLEDINALDCKQMISVRAT